VELKPTALHAKLSKSSQLQVCVVQKVNEQKKFLEIEQLAKRIAKFF